ncbi:MAG: hypothetical protein ABI315_02425 [Bacteroidia bacterium]
MKKIAISIFLLFSTIFCFAQTPEQKPPNESLTACPNFSNNKTVSKVSYFQFLKSNSKKTQQQQNSPSTANTAEKVASTAPLNTEAFPKSALPDYSTIENNVAHKERRKHLFKDKSEAEIAKTASPAENTVIANKSTSTESKPAPTEKRKQLFKEKEKTKEKTKTEIAETTPLAEPTIIENTEKSTKVADKTNDLTEKTPESITHKKGFKLTRKSKIPSPRKQKRAARRKATKCPEF